MKLVGREDALARLRSHLAGGTRTVVVIGMPGAGKTAVLSVVEKTATLENALVVRATCHASDRDLAFGVLADLVAGAPGGQAALERLLPRADRATDPLRLRLDVLDWLEGLSEHRPVLVVVDDAHWCDAASMSVFGFVAHRIGGSQISFLAAARGEAAPESLAEHPSVPMPRLGDADARSLLLEAGIGLDDMSTISVVEHAAGVPLALLELGRAAVGGGGGHAPTSVEAAFAEQLTALPEATRSALLVAAACDGDLVAMGRAVGSADLLAGIAPAESAGLVEVRDRRVHFRHPLVSAAAYTSGTAAERALAHDRLAAAYADDPGRRAWHRAEATVVPDEGVAAELAQVAEEAERSSARTEAARLMIRAAELTPDRLVKDGRLARAVEMNVIIGNFDWALPVASQLRAHSADPSIRMVAARVMAYALSQTGQTDAARAAIVDALERALAVNPLLGWASLTTLAVLDYRAGRDPEVLLRWLVRYELATAGDQGPFPAVIVAARAWIRVQVDPLARPEEVVDLVRTARVPADYPPEVAASHEMLLGAAAWLLEEPTTARHRLRQSLDLMEQAGARAEMGQTLATLAVVLHAMGEYDAADECARVVTDLSEASGLPLLMSEGLELRSRVAASHGDVALARGACRQILERHRFGEAVAIEVNLRLTMSRVRLSEQDSVGAWDELRWLFREGGEPRHPHLSYRDLGHYVSTALRAGEPAESLGQVLELAGIRLPAAGPRYRTQLARARALVSGENAEPYFREAITPVEAAQWPFDLACAQLEFGGWLRRRHRLVEARGQLLAALDAFTRLGTPAWGDMARAELRAAGVATEAPETSAWLSAWAELTGQERQVVRLARSGRTNPEIAAALYLSPRTVSTHLYNAFPKLGVTSRTQLRDVVPEPT